ncbi:predicted protein [Naegleria gruberi]|uniref:Predicted protein n=1 Tax=Naegleria gruberi TaxID=5762 RepID=D2UYT5_NAEGR|nr:uncharacterized protein NAEGRDRAFT_61582 [Naegleria gruberi]EFC50538.1 predicted protein [Naegleria gruberi]|eukprot:XP_002683282.1 predicted protein [Naegleria gruberi strain NEG-M]
MASNGVIFTELNTCMKWNDKYIPENQLIYVRDGTTSCDGGFLVHHFLNSFINHGKKVTLCSFNQSFFHYNTVELKLNINLEKESQEGKFTFIDAQQSFVDSSVETGDDLLLFSSPLLITKTTPATRPTCIVNLKHNNSLDEYLANLFEILTCEKQQSSCIILDHVNPLLQYYFDQDVNRKLLKFITKLKKFYSNNISIIVLMHNHPADDENTQLTNMFEHMSDIVYRVGPLPTGYSKDVHGKVECISYINDGTLASSKKASLHFKTFESKVSLFAPGSVSASHDTFLF